MSHANERAGLLWVLAGFSTLAVGDAIVKGMPGAWPATAMATTRYVIAAIGLTAILVSRGKVLQAAPAAYPYLYRVPNHCDGRAQRRDRSDSS